MTMRSLGSITLAELIEVIPSSGREPSGKITTSSEKNIDTCYVLRLDTHGEFGSFDEKRRAEARRTK